MAIQNILDDDQLMIALNPGSFHQARANHRLGGAIVIHDKNSSTAASNQMKFTPIGNSSSSGCGGNLNVGTFFQGNSDSSPSTIKSLNNNPDFPNNYTGESNYDSYLQKRNAPHYTNNSTAGNFFFNQQQQPRYSFKQQERPNL